MKITTETTVAIDGVKMSMDSKGIIFIHPAQFHVITVETYIKAVKQGAAALIKSSKKTK